MDGLYASRKIVRWEPSPDLPELPLSAFDLSWSGDGTLVCSGYYGHNSTDDFRGLIMQFEAVHAFASFDGLSDVLVNGREDRPFLKVPVTYGGCWPFAEVIGSQWVNDIAAEHCGFGDPHGFAHWAVFTYDQTLHVMAPSNLQPRFLGLIR